MHLLLGIGFLFPTVQAQVIRFSGFDWQVRGAGLGGPGPNAWDPANVWVDQAGALHLKIAPVKITSGQTEWRCAELSTTRRFGFGRFEFQVTGRIDTLDRNVVLGIFTYPTPDVGKDGTNEIDIEFARWGNATAHNGSYTVYPAEGTAPADNHYAFRFALSGNTTTHMFNWSSSQISYRSVHGNPTPRPSTLNTQPREIARWHYSPADPRLIPQQPVPVHINLWLFHGRPPADGRPVEIIVRRFTYTPAGR